MCAFVLCSGVSPHHAHSQFIALSGRRRVRLASRVYHKDKSHPSNSREYACAGIWEGYYLCSCLRLLEGHGQATIGASGARQVFGRVK